MVAVQDVLGRLVGANVTHLRVVRGVRVAHDVPLVGAVRAAAGVGGAVVDRAEVVAQLVRRGVAAPAAGVRTAVGGAEVAQVGLAGALVAGEGADAAVDLRVREDHVLAVAAVEALAGQRVVGGAELAERGRRELDVEHGRRAVGGRHEADVPDAAGLLGARGVDEVGVGRPLAERGEVLGVPVAVGAVDVHDLDAVAAAAVAVALDGLPRGPGGHGLAAAARGCRGLGGRGLGGGRVGGGRVLRTPAAFGGSRFAGLRAGRVGRHGLGLDDGGDVGLDVDVLRRGVGAVAAEPGLRAVDADALVALGRGLEAVVHHAARAVVGGRVRNGRRLRVTGRCGGRGDDVRGCVGLSGGPRLGVVAQSGVGDAPRYHRRRCHGGGDEYQPAGFAPVFTLPSTVPRHAHLKSLVGGVGARKPARPARWRIRTNGNGPRDI